MGRNRYYGWNTGSDIYGGMALLGVGQARIFIGLVWCYLLRWCCCCARDTYLKYNVDFSVVILVMRFAS